jgi:hypothetical protein
MLLWDRDTGDPFSSPIRSRPSQIAERIQPLGGRIVVNVNDGIGKLADERGSVLPDPRAASSTGTACTQTRASLRPLTLTHALHRLLPATELSNRKASRGV